MSLLKSLTGLAKATVQLAKEDKQFRKELAISVATAPIIVGKEFFDTMDNATNATKTYDTVMKKAAERCVSNINNGPEDQKRKFDTWVDKQMRNNDLMSENVEKLNKLKEMMSL
jgi:hypothetical protein